MFLRWSVSRLFLYHFFGGVALPSGFVFMLEVLVCTAVATMSFLPLFQYQNQNQCVQQLNCENPG